MRRYFNFYQPEQIHRHPARLPLKPLTAIAFLLAALATPRVASADVPWWEHPVSEVPYAAAQTGKGVAMWFTSPGAAIAQRMERETWPNLESEIAGENLIWLKLNARDHPEFFSYWQVHQVPSLVILDSTMRDDLRFRGFMDAEEMRLILGEIDRGKVSQLTTSRGEVFSALDSVNAWEQTVNSPDRGALFFEDFDDYEVVGSLPADVFDLYIQADTTIANRGGVENSSSLVIDSGPYPLAVVRILLSSEMEGVQQILGRVRVRAHLRALENIPAEAIPVGAVVVVPKGIRPESAPEDSPTLKLNRWDRGWVQRQAVTEPFYLKEYDVYLLLFVPGSESSFAIDEIRADLLPIDDQVSHIDPHGNRFRETPMGTPTPEPRPGSNQPREPTSRFERLRPAAAPRGPALPPPVTREPRRREMSRTPLPTPTPEPEPTPDPSERFRRFPR